MPLIDDVMRLAVKAVGACSGVKHGAQFLPAMAEPKKSYTQAGVTALVKVATKKLQDHLERHDRHRH